MSRKLLRFSLLLTAVAIAPAALHADEPAPPFPPTGPGSLMLAGSNSYSGGTTISGGTLQVGGLNNLSVNPSANNLSFDVQSSPLNGTYTGSTTLTVGAISGQGTLTLGAGPTWGNNAAFVTAGPVAALSPPPAGNVFYLITEGAGLGDSVRSVACTGKETVLDAVAMINGLSQVSSTKIWIARPSHGDHGKSTILDINWQDISHRGINATNYTLQPGDRLVFGEDQLITRANLLSKRTSILERLVSIASLTSSTVSILNTTPNAVEFMNHLVQNGYISDDQEVKKLMLQMLSLHKQEAKKPDSSATEHKPSQAAETTATTVANESAVPVVDSGETKSIVAVESAPHETAMQPLPAYRIEPPDVIAIEMLKSIPKPPYHAGIFDVFEITANVPADHPLKPYYIVEADGTLDLGRPYGAVRVAGMARDEIRAAVNKTLEKSVREPNAYVQLSRCVGAQPVTGHYLVGPDGTVNLRSYGTVLISGKTVAEAKIAIQDRLQQFFDSPEVSVDVLSFNSKVYYIITQGAGLGASVRRLPVTGNERVLDAVGQINGLSQVSSKKMWIVRPSASNPEKPTILPIDWDAITRRGIPTTNYQIFPGDRLYIGEDRLLTQANRISQKTAIIERLMGVTSLTTSTISGINETPGADEVLKNLVQNGTVTDDDEMKKLVLDMIRIREQHGKKADAKSAGDTNPRK